MTADTFKVGVSRDLRAEDGGAVHGLGLELLDQANRVEWEFMAEHAAELAPETVQGYDAIMIWEPGGVSGATLAGNDRLRLIARFGMGLDAIDLDACAANGVTVTVAPEAVTTAVPAGAMAFVLALAHRLPQKDRMVRAGRWLLSWPSPIASRRRTAWSAPAAGGNASTRLASAPPAGSSG